jgi:6-phosphogluconate dehydrogenase
MVKSEKIRYNNKRGKHMRMNDIGVIGMAVMGKNLALNFADQGFEVVIYNRTTSVAREVILENPNQNLDMHETLEGFVKSLKTPRKLLIMVQAGSAVDKVIESVLPFLEKGDIVMDGGNSFYLDTQKRYQTLKLLGFHFLGVGVSGGEEGARFGPAIMPSGDKEAYDLVQPYLDKIAAKAYGESCAAYVGQDGSGHFVKMVHNGIEYGDMQLIAEAYSVLKEGFNTSIPKIQSIFETWNKHDLSSYLIEITAQILSVKDKHSEHFLVEMIEDVAHQKGTGKWTANASLEFNVDSSVLTSAVFARFMSEIKDKRLMASKRFPKVKTQELELSEAWVLKLEKALYVAKLMSYAQGFELLSNANERYSWNLNFGSIAKGWRAGCIIRAQFLNKIANAYELNSQLEHLLFDEYFASIVHSHIQDLRDVVSLAAQHGFALPTFMNALAYFDGLTTAYSSANLIQAQRDFFGAHTFKRLDKEGNFHDEWK